MATWDVFHSDRLELERALSTDDVRAGLDRGDIGDDDLIRPAGTNTPWVRIGDTPGLLAPPAAEPAPPAPPETEPRWGPGPGQGPEQGSDQELPPSAFEPTLRDEPLIFRDLPDNDDVEYVEPDEGPGSGVSPFRVAEHSVIPEPGPAPAPKERGSEPFGEFDLNLRDRGRDRDESSVEIADDEGDDGLEFVDDDGYAVGEGEYDPLDEDEAAAEFTLARSGAPKVEELDLAAMVDVAFQMVLFFMVTATTVLYKTLEVPKPNPESPPPAAAAQGRSKSAEELKDDFILVEIDPTGAVKVDRDPVPADMAVLTERLRTERERTGRKSMLLSADFTTPHKSAVLAYDAANEIGLGIAIARPSRGGP